MNVFIIALITTVAMLVTRGKSGTTSTKDQAKPMSPPPTPLVPTDPPTLSHISLVPSDSPTTLEPTEDPSLDPGKRPERIFTLLGDVSDVSLLKEVSSAQGTAAHWLIEEDELQLDSDDPSLIQRYVAALFYYSTGGGNLYRCSNYQKYRPGEEWLSVSSECDWKGPSCSYLKVALFG